VVVGDVLAEAAESAAAEIRGAGGRAHAAAVDVTDPGSVHSMVETASAEFGAPQVLVNNAGVWGDLERTPVTETAPEYWDLVMSVNVKGAMLCATAVVPGMRAGGWGRIVNIASVGAWMASGVYGVSKLALIQLTYALATELGNDGITVNAVAPGTIANEATQRQVPAAALDRLVGRNAIKRPGTAADLYGAIRFLCSDDAAWVTGQTVAVDGGFTFRP
jgi:NAD(P)-dependent dehydrogenase (short-subunit alcohol dehydrogenase family)